MSTVASRFAAVFAVAACSCASTNLAPAPTRADAPIVVDGPLGDQPDAPLAGGGDGLPASFTIGLG